MAKTKSTTAATLTTLWSWLDGVLDRFWFWVVWGVLAISLLLRVYHLDRYPLDANSDGLTYAWVGSSMWAQPLQPQGVSMFVADNPNLYWFSHFDYFDTVRRYDLRLVNPFLDQPPFMMPLFGVLPRLFGYSDFEPIPEVLVRLPALLASMLTLGLTYWLGRELFGRKVGLLALTVLGWTPYFVFAHREAFLENFLTPLYLIGLIILWKSRARVSTASGLTLVVLTALGPWFKVVGIVLSAVLSFWLWRQKHRGWAAATLVAGLLSLSSYFVFGWTLFPEAFDWVLQAQSSRGVYAAVFTDFLFKAEFYEPFKDGWYLLGWISWLWVCWQPQKDRATRFITVTGLIMVIGVMGLAGPHNNFPWYRYPMLPLLSLSTALLIRKLWQEKNEVGVAVFSFLGLSNLYFVSQVWPVLGHPLILRLGWVGVLGLVLWSQLRLTNNLRWYRAALVLLVVAGLSVNAVVSLSYPKLFCSLQECKLPTKLVLPLAAQP